MANLAFALVSRSSSLSAVSHVVHLHLKQPTLDLITHQRITVADPGGIPNGAQFFRLRINFPLKSACVGCRLPPPQREILDSRLNYEND